MPFHDGCWSTCCISSFLIRLPVGLPGEHMYTILIDGSEDRVSLILSGCKEKPSCTFKGTCTTAISFTSALTAYIPYVGGHVKILSFPGTQKHRSSASIASSEPTPQNKFSGLRSFDVCVCVFLSLQNLSFKTIW